MSKKPHAFRSSYFVSLPKGEEQSVTVFVATLEDGKYTCVQDGYVNGPGDAVVNEEIGVNSGSGADETGFPLYEEGLSLKEAMEWVQKMEMQTLGAGLHACEEHLGETPDIPHVSEIVLPAPKAVPRTKHKGPRR